MTDNANLLESIGGATALDEIVEAFYQRLVADPELGPVFAGVDVERLVHMQEEFLGVAFGSPEHVADADLRAAHARRAITGRQFSRFVELFCDTLAERDLPRATLDRVADRLALYVRRRGRPVRRRRLSPDAIPWRAACPYATSASASSVGPSSSRAASRSSRSVRCSPR